MRRRNQYLIPLVLAGVALIIILAIAFMVARQAKLKRMEQQRQLQRREERIANGHYENRETKGLPLALIVPPPTWNLNPATNNNNNNGDGEEDNEQNTTAVEMERNAVPATFVSPPPEVSYGSIPRATVFFTEMGTRFRGESLEAVTPTTSPGRRRRNNNNNSIENSLSTVENYGELYYSMIMNFPEAERYDRMAAYEAARQREEERAERAHRRRMRRNGANNNDESMSMSMSQQNPLSPGVSGQQGESVSDPSATTPTTTPTRTPTRTPTATPTRAAAAAAAGGGGGEGTDTESKKKKKVRRIPSSIHYGRAAYETPPRTAAEGGEGGEANYAPLHWANAKKSNLGALSSARTRSVINFDETVPPPGGEHVAVVGSGYVNVDDSVKINSASNTTSNNNVAMMMHDGGHNDKAMTRKSTMNPTLLGAVTARSGGGVDDDEDRHNNTFGSIPRVASPVMSPRFDRSRRASRTTVSLSVADLSRRGSVASTATAAPPRAPGQDEDEDDELHSDKDTVSHDEEFDDGDGVDGVSSDSENKNTGRSPTVTQSSPNGLPPLHSGRRPMSPAAARGYNNNNNNNNNNNINNIKALHASADVRRLSGSGRVGVGAQPASSLTSIPLVSAQQQQQQSQPQAQPQLQPQAQSQPQPQEQQQQQPQAQQEPQPSQENEVSESAAQQQ